MRLIRNSALAVLTFGCGLYAAAQEYTFTTFAGAASSGSADGSARTARFSGPRSVAVDSSGNVYVADAGNHTIRRINSLGGVTTLAGSAGMRGSTNGPGSAARFNNPQGLAVDKVGNMFVADTGNQVVRKITSAGVVTTLAGSAGHRGNSDGTGSTARFTDPDGIAVDVAGNAYVADTLNFTIRKITPEGVVTTLAGLAGQRGNADGTRSAARFSTPQGIAVDRNGNIYVADSFNYTIRKVTPAGVVTTVAGRVNGGSNDGQGRDAGFGNPAGIAVDDSGNVFVADTSNSGIRKITPAGIVTTLAGGSSSGSADGVGRAAGFHLPYGVAVDKSGHVYVADKGNDSIRKITSTGEVTTLAGLTGGSSGRTDGIGNAARFSFPHGLVVDRSGNLFVSDNNNHTIRKITPDGVVTTLAGLAGFSGQSDGNNNAARFYLPSGMAIDSSGNLFVADCLNHTIRKISSEGTVTTWAGIAETADKGGSEDGAVNVARFKQPRGIAADTSGNIYVADAGNSTIRRITPTREVTTLAGSAGNHGIADGNGSTARFNHPWGIAVDGLGNVYVADTDNHTIRKITPAGDVTSFAGSPRVFGASHSNEKLSEFFFPRGIVVDGLGAVFVADFSTIHQITPAGTVTTLAGLAHHRGSDDGTESAARFHFVCGLALDAAGNLYVADSANHTIRKGIVSRK
jgi:sugar lactone lactonase YvrE